MVASHTLFYIIGGFLALPTLSYADLVQHRGIVLPPNASSRKDEVLGIFRDSYQAYKVSAWGHDNVSPVSGGSTDGRNGWGATIVDALSTMKIMGLEDLFKEGVEFASKIDFSKSKTADQVSVFESTIRYVGGLLSAYELSNCQYPALKDKAKQLADKLTLAWVGNNEIPYGYLDFSSNTPKVATSNIAEAGTLTLEWATLSKYTGDDRYRLLAEKSARHIAGIGKPLPGLPAQGIDPTTGQAVGGYITWGGGSDSYFEYLIKYARLNNTQNSVFADAWKLAVDSSIKTLLRTSTVGGYTYLADFDDSRQIRHVGSHLECFHGGNWIFGGRLLDNQTVVDIGLKLVDSCWNTYASTVTGIGPEGFAFISSDGSYRGVKQPPSLSDLSFNSQHGFYTTSPYYILRPEVLESNFYAWRATGDIKYFDRAARAIESFKKYLQVPGSKGYGGIFDVNNGTVGAGRIDDTESFWFAEVLKYLYLTFDDPSHISLDECKIFLLTGISATDFFCFVLVDVFNTEAHPFRVPTSTSTYGSGSPTSPEPPFKTVPGKLPDVSAIPTVPDLISELVDLVDHALDILL